MITLGPSRGDFSTDLLDRKGAFLWWYVDLIDENGNGAVFIWSFGLPFLPGLASAARRGKPQAPGERPSWSLSVFEGGRESFYLLSEYDPADCEWIPSERKWRYGDTFISHTEKNGRVSLTTQFNAAAPGLPGQLTGTLSLEGPLRKTNAISERAADHSWEPLCLGGATGNIDIACGNYSANINGRIYYDRNAGDRPLHALGIRDWFWGRFAMPDHELVVYLLHSESGDDENYVLFVRDDGELVQEANAKTQYSRYGTSRLGSRYPTLVEVTRENGKTLEISLQPPMDDSPFYRRFVGRCASDGHEAIGVFEHVLPHAIDPNWMRPLVHMRIHQTTSANSMWLPLFSGPKQGRWGRLFRSWLPSTETAR